MINENFFLGLPVNFQNICMIYPPTVAQVLQEKNFGQYKRVFTITQEEIEDEFIEQKIDLSYLLTPFEYLLNNCFNNDVISEIVIQGFQFFLHEKVTILPKQKKVVIGDLEKLLEEEIKLESLRMIDENNYFDFQNMIRQSVGEKKIEKPDENEDPRIKKMKAKMRLRDKVKSKKEAKEGATFSDTLISLCCMDMGLNPLNIRDLSFASISPLVRRYQEKQKYQLDIDSILAGADSKKVKPKSWLGKIDD